MHNAALQAVGLTNWRYQLLPVPPELLTATVRALPEAGFRGVNVTIPHKERALGIAHRPSASAQAIGAANLLVFEEGGVIAADNTDAPALLQALPHPALQRTALVLGAGGSARAVVWALGQAGAEVRVWNRSPERAQALAEELGAVAVADVAPADFLVNCTPVGLAGRPDELKQLPVKADDLSMFGCVIDLVYSGSETELIRAAKSAGKPTVDGFELLLGQGALSFQRLTGVAPPVEQMAVAAHAG